MEVVTFAEWIKAIIELGFPVGVSIYLLIVLGKQLESFKAKLVEVKIALYLILSKLDILEEYERALKEYRASESRKEGDYE